MCQRIIREETEEYFVQLLEFVDLFLAESKLEETSNMSVPATITTDNGMFLNPKKGEY